MNGLIFFKLVSPYKEDKTKDCGLRGEDIDANFFNLKEELIKTAYWEDETFILERVDGDIIRVSGITEGCTKNLDIKYDKEQGALIVTQNGITTLITGFTTESYGNNTIFSDDSLNGDGTKDSPLTLSPLAKTGQYKPVIKLVDTTKNEKLPDCKTLAVGDRYLTNESISDFGYLYDYNSVSKISGDLRDASSPWRVPTKEDWDNMLNAVEPRLEDKNHDKVTSNRYLGRFAGKLLKSFNFWRLESNTPDCGCDCDCSSTPDCNNYTKTGCEEIDPYCKPSCGELKPNCNCKHELYPNRGIDKYGFAAVPAGYGDDGNQILYFSERGWYWTATNSQCLNAYTKRFEYDKSSVYQEVIGVNNLLSLRLIKDYDGSNYNERESILGSDYSTILMPSKNGKTIWTSTNVAFSNRYYNPVAPNNGIGLTYSRQFFINEWNGKRWLKNEMKNGDSVVILKAPSGEDNIEYRVINGVLSNVAESVYDDVIITIKPDLDNLKGMIGAEIVRAKEAERQLQMNIDAETARAVFSENKLQEKIDNEVDRAINAETILQENIDKVNDSVEGIVEKIEIVDAKIDAEIERATDAETVLQTNIDIETARATDAETVLDNKIKVVGEALKNEIIRATDAETVLQTNIDTETTRATDAENKLREDLEAEILRSTNKDVQLETAIEDIKNDITDSNAKIDEIDVKLDNEIKRSSEQDRLITEKLLSKDGHKFDPVEGTLLLSTLNPENNIVIDLDFNFGTF